MPRTVTKFILARPLRNDNPAQLQPWYPQRGCFGGLVRNSPPTQSLSHEPSAGANPAERRKTKFYPVPAPDRKCALSLRFICHPSLRITPNYQLLIQFESIAVSQRVARRPDNSLPREGAGVGS